MTKYYLKKCCVFLNVNMNLCKFTNYFNICISSIGMMFMLSVGILMLNTAVQYDNEHYKYMLFTSIYKLTNSIFMFFKLVKNLKNVIHDDSQNSKIENCLFFTNIAIVMSTFTALIWGLIIKMNENNSCFNNYDDEFMSEFDKYFITIISQLIIGIIFIVIYVSIVFIFYKNEFKIKYSVIESEDV